MTAALWFLGMAALSTIFLTPVVLTPPQLVPKRLLNGVFELNLESGMPVKYTLYGSTDLQNWVELMTTTSDGIQVQLTDPDAGNFSFRFYRVAAESAQMLTPVITAQPQSQTVEEGSQVTFTVGASGTGLLSYRWMFNGDNIEGAYEPDLTINYAQNTDSGNYTVLVSNADGSVMSQVAKLTVNPPSLTPETLAGRTMSLTVTDGDSPFAQGGAAYSIQFAADTDNYFVLPVTPDVSASSGTYTYSKTGPTTARITVKDSESGIVTTELTFLDLREGNFKSTAGDAQQTGNFTLR